MGFWSAPAAGDEHRLGAGDVTLQGDLREAG
jgi:hypothetical protein